MFLSNIFVCCLCVTLFLEFYYNFFVRLELVFGEEGEEGGGRRGREGLLFCLYFLYQ